MSPISEGASDDVRQRYEFAAQFADAQTINAIRALMREATEKEDYEQSVDYVVPGACFALRCRRLSSVGDRRDFTLRSSLPSGRKTEVDKLASGEAKCTHYCYGFVNSRNVMREWFFVDMHVFCAEYLNYRHGTIKNRDGTQAAFWPFDCIPQAVIWHEELEFELPKSNKCSDCWENREKWVTKKGKSGMPAAFCKACGRFIGYLPPAMRHVHWTEQK